MSAVMGDRQTQRYIIENEGVYDSIEEWEEEEITIVQAPATMWVMVHGPPRSKEHPWRDATIDDILQQYLREMKND